MKKICLFFLSSILLIACTSPRSNISAAKAGVYNTNVPPQQQDAALRRDMHICLRHAQASMPPAPSGAYTRPRPARVPRRDVINTGAPNIGAFIAGMESVSVPARPILSHPYHQEVHRRAKLCMTNNGWKTR